MNLKVVIVLNIIKIAKELNVSASTVSRALNDKAGVSEKQRQKIKEYAKKIGYRPSIIGKTLVSKQENSIAIVVSSINWLINSWHSIMYYQLIHKASSLGFFVDLLTIHDLKARKDEFNAAIILDGERYKNIANIEGMPTVFIGHGNTGYRVVNDDFTGGMTIAKHLITLGVTNYYFVGFSNSLSIKSRYLGAKEVLSKHNFTLTKIATNKSINRGIDAYSAINEYFANKLENIKDTALICATDEHAYGAYKASMHLNIACPEDLKITGYDGLPLYIDEVTTCRQDFSKIADEVFELLKQAKEDKKDIKVEVPSELIINKTTTNNN